MKLIKRIDLFIVILTLAFISFSNSASAFGDVKITIDSNLPISWQDIAPGDHLVRKFTVENSTSEIVTLSMKIQGSLSQDLELPLSEQIILQIKRPDGTFSSMPSGTGFETLSELFQKSENESPYFAFDALAGPTISPANYELWTTFSKNAGNEYQGKEIKFDLSINVRSDKFNPASNIPVSNAENENNEKKKKNINNEPKIETSSFQIINAARISDIDAASIGGGSESNSQIGMVEGATSTKQNAQEKFPKNFWLFLFASYISLIAFNLFYGFKNQTLPHWGWEALYTGATLGTWFLLDPEKIFGWFPILVLISGALLFATYNFLLTKKLTR
jgi:hypothetical protein